MKRTKVHVSTRQNLHSIQSLIRFAIFSAMFLTLVGAQAIAQTQPTASINVVSPADRVDEQIGGSRCAGHNRGPA
jgi:hypothetical protein